MGEQAAERPDGKQMDPRGVPIRLEPSDARAGLAEEPFEKRFERVYRTIYPRALRYARSRVGGHDADDAVQKVMIRLWKKCEKQPNVLEKPIAVLEAIVITGVTNETKTLWLSASRSARRARSMSGDDEKFAADDGADDSDMSSEDPDRLDLREVVLREVARLPPKCREAYQLVRFGDLTYKEAAARMGTSPATVHQHVCKANRILGEALKKYGPPDYDWSVRKGGPTEEDAAS